MSLNPSTGYYMDFLRINWCKKCIICLKAWKKRKRGRWWPVFKNAERRIINSLDDILRMNVTKCLPKALSQSVKIGTLIKIDKCKHLYLLILQRVSHGPLQENKMINRIRENCQIMLLLDRNKNFFKLPVGRIYLCWLLFPLYPRQTV